MTMKKGTLQKVLVYIFVIVMLISLIAPLFMGSY
jgi:hypothetical protein